jgi:hypothetical protein
LKFQAQITSPICSVSYQGIASLQDELATVENEIGILIQKMEKSIDEADAFIQEMTQQES